MFCAEFGVAFGIVVALVVLALCSFRLSWCLVSILASSVSSFLCSSVSNLKRVINLNIVTKKKNLKLVNPIGGAHVGSTSVN